MSDHDDIVEENEGGKWQNYLAIGILLVAYATAVVNVLLVHKNELQQADDRVVLRLTHWQLEAGVVDTLNTMAREFEKVYEQETGVKLKIIQNPINERAYKQYVQTQCIGGTAPDLVEVIFNSTSEANYTRRFFLATSDYAGIPNPYNKGTNLEGVRWADTFRDGMYNALDTETMEYYGAPLSMLTTRMFYNKRMLKEALGMDEPPSDYRSFLECCDKLNAWAKAKGMEGFRPIAGSEYMIGSLLGWSLNPLSFQLMMDSDLNLDGKVADLESIASYVLGKYSEKNEEIKAGHELLRSFTKYYPDSFMSKKREEAGFRFSRGLGAFIVSGAWDANSYIQNSDFPVGVCSFPLPLRSDKTYGKFLSGPQSEAEVGGSMRFGVTKFSRNPEVAVKFLMFLTSQKNNEWINKKFKWIPVIHGTQAYGVMKDFMPRSKGFWGWTVFGGGSKTTAVHKQAYWNLFEQRITYDEFANNLRNAMPRAIAADLQQAMRELRERRVVMDANVSWTYAQELFGNEWGLPKAAAQKCLNDAAKRVNYAWESRAGALNIQIPLLLKNALEKDDPFYRQIRSFLTFDPFAE